MASSFQLLLGGAPADAAVMAALGTLEVEESVELPSAVELEVGVSRSEAGDLTFVDHARLAPYTPISVVVQVEGSAAECIFDGNALSYQLHLPQNAVGARLQVWGQDSSWLMNLEEKTREWVGVTDGVVANTIFGDYGLTPGPDNTRDDSPPYDEAGRTLMQRGSDIQFLRGLASRSGKHCRVVPGRAPGQGTGVFAAPQLSGPPVATLALHDASRPTVQSLDFAWDVMRPTRVTARAALHDDPSEDGANGDASADDRSVLGARGLLAYAGRPMTTRLTTTTASAGGLKQRARAVIGEASYFVRCTGEADVAQLGAVLRAGTVVAVAGAGATCSGNYYVSSVRHRLSAESHRMSFVLLRNALGGASTGARLA